MSNITPINEKLHALSRKKYETLEAMNATPQYWEYRNKWQDYPNNNIVDIPLNIDIELTNACNLKCVMCPRTVLGLEKTGFMSEYLYRKIIDDASQLGVPAIKLLWRGESTLHPEIVSFIKYAKGKGIIDVLLNTNATLLDAELSKQIIDAGIDKVFFSFDSPFREKYESIRIGADFDTVLDNIKSFMNIREKSNHNKPITRIGMVRMKQNFTETDAFIKLFSDIVDCVAYTDAFYLENKKNDSVLDDERFNNFTCPMPWQRLVVSWEGKCYPCCRDEKETYQVGNLVTQTIKEIWKSEKLSRLREAHLSHTWKKLKLCVDCQKSLFIENERVNGMI